MTTKMLQKFDTFGDALRYAIEFRRLTDSEFSKKIGKNKSHISKWVNNYAMPRPTNINKIETILELNFVKQGEKWVLQTNNYSQSDAQMHQIQEPSSLKYGLDGLIDKVMTGNIEDLDLEHLPDIVRVRDRFQETLNKLIDKKRP